uniref:Uncharacterized protein n=1 Tax=Human betaherpesvirus 6 TaxID=10368 RepID=A0A5P9UM54_9BETA|nr:hypothetical protein [Human betaherpesvirus 6]QFV47770.1 hypothetical protein [Human betaherpesvirus 6]QFV49775.1 hypothetical protein [Human betaherpesvirus 6]QFW66614.1 hypothetical protein [Human betaherpesvirus 6]QFW95483.1 hypothetical protein [Human betaherpesvirus 6]
MYNIISYLLRVIQGGGFFGDDSRWWFWAQSIFWVGRKSSNVIIDGMQSM